MSKDKSYQMIRDCSDKELFLIYSQSKSEMKKRGLGASVGEIGEKIAIQFFNNQKGLPTLQDAPVGTRNIDAISREGDRYSIKTVQSSKKTGTIYPHPEDKALFEYLLIVILDENLDLRKIYRLSWDDFTEKRAWDRRMNAWYIPVSTKRLAGSEIVCSL